MKSELLLEISDHLETRHELLDKFFPKLKDFDQQNWDMSKLGDTQGNSLCHRFAHLGAEDQSEISDALRDIPQDDLIELQHPTEHELEARKALTQIQLAIHRLENREKKCTRHLIRLQAIREFGLAELERRQLAKVAEDGVPLDPFTARFIYGPAPLPLVPPFQNGIPEPKPRKFYLARVKSGKTVAIDRVRFSIPEPYRYWVSKELTAAGLKATDMYHHIPYTPTPDQAKLYLKLGFRPEKKLTVNYQYYWHHNTNYGANNDGWNIYHSREMDAKDVTPVD